MAVHAAGLRSELEKKELRMKAEEYLNRAEELKKIVKSQEGLSYNHHVFVSKEQGSSICKLALHVLCMAP